MARRRASPGGVGDGLPALPDGEPLLQRWFVVAMLVLAVAAIATTAVAFLSFGRDPIPLGERRPPGTDTITHDRGSAVLNDTTDTEDAPGCASGIDLFGDDDARATGRRALETVCFLLDRGGHQEAQIGMSVWKQSEGLLRVAVFEVTGTESSARLEDGRVIIEIGPRFQRTDAASVAPMIIHELVHIAGGWPGRAVSAEQELEAMLAQHAACSVLPLGDNPPRGCGDAREIASIAEQDREAALRLFTDAGYRSP